MSLSLILLVHRSSTARNSCLGRLFLLALSQTSLFLFLSLSLPPQKSHSSPLLLSLPALSHTPHLLPSSKLPSPSPPPCHLLPAHLQSAGETNPARLFSFQSCRPSQRFSGGPPQQKLHPSSTPSQGPLWCRMVAPCLLARLSFRGL